MTSIVDRYFSFHGALARLPFFVRNIHLGLAASVLVVLSVPLFGAGNALLWWAGVAVVTFTLVALIYGALSMIVRRLHDIGLSGYHAIWVAGAELGWTALSYGPPAVVWLSLPLLGIQVWLLFYPGKRKPIASQAST